MVGDRSSWNVVMKLRVLTDAPVTRWKCSPLPSLCSLCYLLNLLLIHPGERIRTESKWSIFLYHRKCDVNNNAVQTKQDGRRQHRFGCSGQLLPSSHARIHIAPPPRSPASLNVAWHAYGRTYQMTPHSTPDMLHISSIMRHVFKHPAPTCSPINIHLLTAEGLDTAVHWGWSKKTDLFLERWRGLLGIMVYYMAFINNASDAQVEVGMLLREMESGKEGKGQRRIYRGGKKWLRSFPSALGLHDTNLLSCLFTPMVQCRPLNGDQNTYTH